MSNQLLRICTTGASGRSANVRRADVWLTASTERITTCAFKWVWGILLLAATSAQSYASLNQAYAALGFNPNHPGNSVAVLFSDPHMNLDPSILLVTTNLDPRLVGVINSMNPAPAKIFVSGDTSTTLSPIPGWRPRDWSMSFGTNEMRCWLAAITAITNTAVTNILWIPGNHDTLHFETNAETYRLLYPMMPTWQRVDVAGVRFFLMNCGNFGARDAAQTAWLKREVAQTPTNQPIVVITHVPPFWFPPLYRGPALDLREVLGGWPVPWWTFSGHYHARSMGVYNVWRTKVASMVIGTANPNNTNGKSYDSGCAFLCLSNGIAGVVYYHYNDESFEAVSPPNWNNPKRFLAAFEEVPGVFWYRLKTREPAPEVTRFVGEDAVEWYSYTQELEWALPRYIHRNQASHFLLLAMAVSPTARLEFSADGKAWQPAALPTPTEYLYSVPIPSDLAKRSTLYARYVPGPGGNLIAGWGLRTTNPPPWLLALGGATLIAERDRWRFLDSGAEPGAAWSSLGYDDSLWKEGPALLGYGEGDEVTILSAGPEPAAIGRTAYFRRVFQVTGTAPISNLDARLICDDGAVVHLNGAEVFRRNMPAGAIAPTTPAVRAIEGDEEREAISFPIPPHLLKQGANVIAVEVHQYPNSVHPYPRPDAFWSFDQPEPPWNDTVGTNHFSRVGVGVAAGPGKLNGCATNDYSAAGYLTATDSPELSYSGPFTVGGWFAFGPATVNRAAGLEKAYEFSLYYSGTSLNRYRFELNGTYVQDQTSGTTAGQWRFVVGWYDGTNINIQVDNGVVYSAPATPPRPTSSPLVALKRTLNSGGLAADEVFLYKRALTAAERAARFHGQTETNASDLSFDFELMGTWTEAPKILTAPESLVRCKGQTAAFSVNVASVSGLSYQWHRNGRPLAGQTNSLLFVTFVTPEDAGSYFVTVSNLTATVTTPPATLTVIGTPELRVLPLEHGSSFSFEVPGYGVPSTLLVSSNLVDWSELVRLPALFAATNYVDAGASNAPSRFYRLRLDP
ncbi:MAG TPA: LamG-like jellyroll fold domain-containing protein [Verrucomicrobiae bacterium]